RKGVTLDSVVGASAARELWQCGATDQNPIARGRVNTIPGIRTQSTKAPYSIAMNGQMLAAAASKDSRQMLETTNSRMPTGGVIEPRVMLNQNRKPKRSGSRPKSAAIGASSGASMMIMALASMNIPATNSIAMTMVSNPSVQVVRH